MLSHFRQTIRFGLLLVIVINRFLHLGQRLRSISPRLTPVRISSSSGACPIVSASKLYDVSSDTQTNWNLICHKNCRILIRKLKEHSRLAAEDLAAINSLSHIVRKLQPDEDLIRQGDDPDVSAVVLSGMVARYHLLPNGSRQYLSFHMSGDMPRLPGTFVEKMDHAVCAIGPALIASIPHKELLATFKRQPSVAFAIWRETLIDAAIFREAITNNSARTRPARMAPYFVNCSIGHGHPVWRKETRSPRLLVSFNWRNPWNVDSDCEWKFAGPANLRRWNFGGE